MQVETSTKNRRFVIFKDQYPLRFDVTIQPGDEFPVGRGHGEFSLDEEGYLVVFVGEFTPHRVAPRYFDIVDEFEATTVKKYRRFVK